MMKSLRLLAAVSMTGLGAASAEAAIIVQNFAFGGPALDPGLQVHHWNGASYLTGIAPGWSLSVGSGVMTVSKNAGVPGGDNHIQTTFAPVGDFIATVTVDFAGAPGGAIANGFFADFPSAYAGIGGGMWGPGGSLAISESADLGGGGFGGPFIAPGSTTVVLRLQRFGTTMSSHFALSGVGPFTQIASYSGGPVTGAATFDLAPASFGNPAGGSISYSNFSVVYATAGESLASAPAPGALALTALGLLGLIAVRRCPFKAADEL